MTPVHLGISTCPNDTFAFHAILNQKIDLRGLEFRIELLDVDELNKRLLRGEFEQAMEQALLGASLATTTDQQRVQLGLIRANAKELKKTVEEL